MCAGGRQHGLNFDFILLLLYGLHVI